MKTLSHSPEAQVARQISGPKNSLSRRLSKGLSTLTDQGPLALMCDVIYSIYYHRHERRKNQYPSKTHQGGDSICIFGQEYALHPSRKGINEELQLFGVHEPLATSVYQGLLRPGDHVIDVGANIGYYIIVANQVVGDRGRFLAFEPLPSNYAVLKRNADRLGQDRVRVWPWAIGANNETAPFYESDVPNWGSLISNERLAPGRSISVDVKRLDDVVETVSGFQPTVLRMDIEGGELMALAGAQELLRTYRPLLFIEFHTFAIGVEALRSTLEELLALGYEEGVLIDRVWDQPWISPWARGLRYWHGRLECLSQRIGPGTFTLFMR